MTKKNIIGLVFWLVLSLTLTALVYQKNKINQLKQDLKVEENLVNSLSDTLVIKNNRDSSQTVTISLLQTKSNKDFINLQAKDSVVKELQQLVKNNKNSANSATIIRTETKFITSNPTIITKYDTIRLQDSNLLISNPIYTSKISMGKWINGSSIANKDSTILDLVIDNNYEIVIGEKGKFLSWKKQSFVELTNHNPYTKTKVLRTYQVATPRKRRFGLGVFTGYGLSLQTIPKLAPTIGVGLQYNLIEF